MKSLKIKVIALLVASGTFYGCSSEFLDVNENPNTANTGDPGLLLAAGLANIAGEFATGLGTGGSTYARQTYGLGASTYAITGATYQQDWNSLYASGLKDLQVVQTLATGTENNGYLGISKVMMGYAYHQLVDYFGDIPFTEALQGETIITPKFDDDAAVYDAVLLMLDEAITNLEDADTNGDVITGDILLGGDYDAWINVANTLKLKMFLNIGNVDATRARTAIDALIVDDRLIDDNSENWVMTYADQQTPNHRHPFFNSQYDGGPGYLANEMMLQMVNESDPRIRFYFYRQSEYGDLDFDTTPCSSRTDCATWDELFATGTNYMGRDHGDPSGLPGDDDLVTVPGLYPVGGKYDDSSYRTVNGVGSETVNGAEGAGIMPLFTASMTNFMLAEAVLNLGVTSATTAEEYFEAGMQASFDMVRAFADGTESEELAIITAYETAQGIDYDANVTNYIAGKVADYAAGSTAEQLALIMGEKNIASWGNGMESYTDLRRTGFPDFPDALAPQGAFPSRVLYPDSEVSGNPNTPIDVVQSTPIFWDN